jgi:hypothetical protein
MESVARNLTIRVVPGRDHHSLPGADEFADAIRGFIAAHAAPR